MIENILQVENSLSFLKLTRYLPSILFFSYTIRYSSSLIWVKKYSNERSAEIKEENHKFFPHY